MATATLWSPFRTVLTSPQCGDPGCTCDVCDDPDCPDCLDPDMQPICDPDCPLCGLLYPEVDE